MPKKIPYPGSYYDCVGFECWLNDRSAEGLRLKGFTLVGHLPTFHEEEPRRVRYYIEPDFDQYTPEQAEKAYTDLGWKYLDEYRGICLIYESDDPWAVKPRKQFEERDWNKKWRKLWVDFFGFLLLDVYSLYKIFMDDLSNFSPSDPNIYRAMCFSMFIFLALFLLGPMVERLYDIVTCSRCVRRHEEPICWPWVRGLQKGTSVIFWLLMIVIFLNLMIIPNI